MGLNREKQFPDPAQRELQDKADALRDAAESLTYATRKVPLDAVRIRQLTLELDECRNQFRVALYAATGVMV
jgi:hypothetical protein